MIPAELIDAATYRCRAQLDALHLERETQPAALPEEPPQPHRAELVVAALFAGCLIGWALGVLA